MASNRGWLLLIIFRIFDLLLLLLLHSPWREGEALISAWQKVINIISLVRQRLRSMRRMSWWTIWMTKKRLYRAKLHAGRKVKAAAAKNRKMDGPRKEWRHRSQGPLDSQNPSLSHIQQSSSASIAATRTIPTVQGLGPCFMCGKMEHFRRSCPLLQSSIPTSK